MSLTTDPKDPELGHGVDDTPIPQHKKYLVLSDEELAKGFVRPVRRSYKHVGLEVEVRKYMEDGTTSNKAHVGGCGTVTSMGLKLCETYARNPKFYGSTYCTHCMKHLPVEEFTWTEDGQVVGS